MQSVVKKMYKYARDALRSGVSYLGKIEPKSSRLAKQKQKSEERRRQKTEQARRDQDRTYDFWASIKKGRTAQYRIPHLNRHSS